MKRTAAILAAIAGLALAIAAVWRIFDPKTPLRYPFPRSATEPCEGGDANPPTQAAVEGPVYKPNTPERRVIREPWSIGRPLVIEGRVFSTAGEPLRGAVLDFWNCDGNGKYDLKGFHLRGHQYSGRDGAYHLDTVKPGDYEQLGFHRTPHVHVKVQAPHAPLLTTQLFFPGEPLNEQDLFIKESLIMEVSERDDGSLHAHFDFFIGGERTFADS